MNYLDLTNKVINESGSELDELTSVTWSGAAAGRRLYPRIKRLVREAWKVLQMERNEWEFKTAELSTIVYPRLKIQNGLRAAGTPPVGTVFKGDDSDFTFTVRRVLPISGDWVAGTASAQLEFDADYIGASMLTGEVFTEVTPVLGDGGFTYLYKGSYDFSDDALTTDLREIQWSTFVASLGNTTPVPVLYIPWENWLYKDLSFTQNTTSAPAYVSQDFEGNVVFYPQTLDPFRINFIYDTAPQELVDYDDVPTKLQAEYHEWIAWRALMNLARYDKNPDLYAYAESMATTYKTRAERNLMPIPSWRDSRYNYPNYG